MILVLTLATVLAAPTIYSLFKIIQIKTKKPTPLLGVVMPKSAEKESN